MTAAIFGLIGVVVGALINGVASALSQRRTERADRRSSARLVHTELSRYLSLAVVSSRWAPDDLPQLRDAAPVLWQGNRAILARALSDEDWERVASAYAHIEALVSVLVFEDGRLAGWRAGEAKRLLSEMKDPLGDALVALQRATDVPVDQRDQLPPIGPVAA